MDTDSQFSSMLPLLLMKDDLNSTSDSLMLMMMMQTIGNQPIGMEQVNIYIFLKNFNPNAVGIQIKNNATSIIQN